MSIPSVSRPSLLIIQNRIGWKSFLALNIIYARLVMAFCAVSLCLMPHAHAELPSAPTPNTTNAPRYGTIDYSLAATIMSERVLDFTSTSECLRRPATQCHEVELPTSLVRNKAAFAGFEVGMAGISLWEQYELTKHGHRRMSRIVTGANAAWMGFVVAHNYKLAR